MITKRLLLVIFVFIPTVAFAGYGWQTYVDPKIEQVWRGIRVLHERVKTLEARVSELEKAKP
jgi:hypothetical protein